MIFCGRRWTRMRRLKRSDLPATMTHCCVGMPAPESSPAISSCRGRRKVSSRLWNSESGSRLFQYRQELFHGGGKHSVLFVDGRQWPVKFRILKLRLRERLFGNFLEDRPL